MERLHGADGLITVPIVEYNELHKTIKELKKQVKALEKDIVNLVTEIGILESELDA